MVNREGVPYEQLAEEQFGRQQAEASRLGLWLLLVSISIFFIALTVVLALRSRVTGEWTGVPMPWGVWVSTAVLAVSSWLLERGDRGQGVRLGWVFLVVQIFAWWQIVSFHGPGSWFFWTFSGLHAIHVLGGLAAFRWARFDLARIYWHFLTGLWVYVMLLFLIVRA
jgi:cytochrome c oxidase subunit 3